MAYTILAWAVLVSTAAVQEGKPDLSGPLRLPGLSTVKEKVGPTAEQSATLEAIYKDAAAKHDEIRKSGKEDPKKAAESIQAARTEAIARIKEALNDEQDRKFDELTKPGKKKDGK